MKQLAIAIVLCVGAWYFFIGGRKLDEQLVHAYYQSQAQATQSRDAAELCKQISKKAVIESSVTMMGRTVETTQNRQEACDTIKTNIEMFSQIGNGAGGALSFEYDYHIDTVELTSNRKSATVKGTSVLKMGEALQFKSSFTQRLERELGQMRLVHSDGVTMVRMVGRGAMSQSDFFRK